MAHQEIQLTIHPPLEREECPSFIFNVSSVLEKDHRMSYKPQLVSIGPYHHNRGDHLRMMEEHKRRYLNNLLERVNLRKEDLIQRIRVNLREDDLIQRIRTMEIEIRARYWSSFTDIDSDNFLKMLVLDGCFVIEFFRFRGEVVRYKEGEPLFALLSINSLILRDLMLAENQLPYQLLDNLYQATKVRNEGTLADLVIKVLNRQLCRFNQVPQNVAQSSKHILDLARKSLTHKLPVTTIPCQWQRNDNSNIITIRRIEDLRRSGIKIYLNKDSNDPFAIEFKRMRGILLIPKLELTDFTFPLYRNFISLEQCTAGSPKPVTTYFYFLSNLIHTDKDMDYLCEEGIIVNSFDTNSVVASLIHQTLAGASFRINDCYLTEMFYEVNNYCGCALHAQYTTFKRTYFDSPWIFFSALAVLIVLISTVISTIFTVLSYYHRPN